MGFEDFSKKELINLVETLLERVIVLEKKVDSLNIKVAELLEENQILKVKKNSSNSSIAPSSDFSKVNKSNSLRQKSGLKKGGQSGHKGHTLEMSSTPNEVIVHVPFFCNSCGFNLENLPETLTERRQVIDLPPIVPIYTEHQSFSKICLCGKVCKGSFPQNINAPIQYGESIECLASYFSVRQYLPYQRMKEMLSDVFGVSICQASLVNAISRFAQKALPVYNRIKANIQKAEVVGSDETGMKVNGKKGWYFAWQNKFNTLIDFSFSRGFDTIEMLFPQGFNKSVMVTDCWAAQLKVNANAHQICLAHLTRELNYFIETNKCQWEIEFKDLLVEAIKLKEKIINYDIPIPERQNLELRLEKLLNFTELSKNKKLRAFQKRMLKHKNKLFPFLYHPEVPPDNNATERAIRNVKVKQKVSGQFVSEQCAKDFAVIRSVLDTVIKNKVNIFDSLKIIAQI